jgi:hypothetical protein
VRRRRHGHLLRFLPVRCTQAVWSALLLGCATPAPKLVEVPLEANGHRIVVIDDAFTDVEREKIVGELYRIEQERPGLTFGVMSGSMAWAFGAPPFSIKIIAVHETSCTHTKIAFGCWVPPDRIEFAPDILEEFGDWKAVTREEIAHALGLRDPEHSP